MRTCISSGRASLLNSATAQDQYTSIMADDSDQASQVTIAINHLHLSSRFQPLACGSACRSLALSWAYVFDIYALEGCNSEVAPTDALCSSPWYVDIQLHVALQAAHGVGSQASQSAGSGTQDGYAEVSSSKHEEQQSQHAAAAVTVGA